MDSPQNDSWWVENDTMSLSGYLDERADTRARYQHQAERDSTARLWMDHAVPPEVRLIRFDEWLRDHLDGRLDWKWAGEDKVKRREQCRMQIDTMILGLWRRGWMLDGNRLAARIIEMLDAIAKAQRKGEVRDFWPYFKAAVDRYVGSNAEELREEAMSAGVAVGDVLKQLVKGMPAGPAMPELIAKRTEETLREKVSKQRRKEARKIAEAAQAELF